MTQVSSYTIADADGLTVLADINAKLAAIQSVNSGTTGPSSPVTGMPWLDTSGSTPVRRRRNAANSGWDLDDLPAVGMGVTSVTAVGSCDALTLGGAYLASSGATGAPVGGTAFILFHGVGATSSDAVQEAFALGSDRAFSRRKVAGTWQAWVEAAIGATATGLGVLQAANQAAARTAILAYGSSDLASAADIAAATAGKLVDAAKFQSERLKLGTSLATTSGTSKDFTGIPSWAKRITVLLDGVSVSGTSVLLIQAGTGGSPTTTGYTSGAIQLSGASTAPSTFTTGFGQQATGAVAASETYSGKCTLELDASNKWVATHTNFTGSKCSIGGGTIALAGALDNIRLTTVNGTDTFDAGSVNIDVE